MHNGIGLPYTDWHLNYYLRGIYKRITPAGCNIEQVPDLCHGSLNGYILLKAFQNIHIHVTYASFIQERNNEFN